MSPILYPVCHQFIFLNKDLNIHKDFFAVEDTSCYGQEIGDLQNDKLRIDSFDIVSNAFTILGFHEDQIIPFENLKNDEQIDRSACDRSAKNIKDSP
jgi:hypothetical protein